MKLMKKILILGGTGFIGYNLSKTLQKDSNNIVHVADNLSRGQLDNYIKSLLKNDIDLFKGSSFNFMFTFLIILVSSGIIGSREGPVFFRNLTFLFIAQGIIKMSENIIAASRS